MAADTVLIKGGRLLDPQVGLDRVADVTVREGRISQIAPDIAASVADSVVDASGALVTPSLVDLHTHVYWGGTSLGVDPLAYARASSVGLLVDAGSAGPGNYPGFLSHVISPCPIPIKAFLHVSFAGIFGFSEHVLVGESEEIRLLAPRDALRVIEAHPEHICGLKVRVGQYASGTNGAEALEIALSVAEAASLPLMAHIDYPPPSYDDVVRQLRPGDILTHAFHPPPNAPHTVAGEVKKAVLDARDRGVLFDIGHGRASFSFETAEKMLDQGFLPDIISSDVHALCIDGPAFNLLDTMSKFLHLGVPLAEIVSVTTETPRRAIHAPTAKLEVGAKADVSVFQLKSGRRDLVDGNGGTRRINSYFEPRAVISKQGVFTP